ncbi:MAG: hypothetical protein HY473_00220 [Candidatus Sungbacteria bacterium]|uniref:Lipoprotein n=1 Tax=Candidatus Sungiibacteriota bacterium TaxID=2750080 RepID=A0A932YW55_9BACT|nr:hypothetical protein [Candidatus Sungbacteria bacterium]
MFIRALRVLLLVVFVFLAGCASVEKVVRRAAEGGLVGSAGGPLGLAAGTTLGIGIGVSEVLSGGREQAGKTAEVLREKGKGEQK